MLDPIIAHKHLEVRQLEMPPTLARLQDRAAQARPPRDFKRALQTPGIALIAEIKRQSPSKGVLRQDFDPLAIAEAYVSNGARALSVLADSEFFGGGPEIVELVANAPQVTVPVMFKEFVLRPAQVYLARAVGADALLLIVRVIDQPLLEQLLALTHTLGMHALVEVFSDEDARRALDAGAAIIGINNRNLQTFEVDMRQAERIRALLPTGVVSVSESGMRARADVVQAERSGFDAMLVGETLMTAADIGAKVRELLGRGHDG